MTAQEQKTIDAIAFKLSNKLERYCLDGSKPWSIFDHLTMEYCGTYDDEDDAIYNLVALRAAEKMK